MKRTKYLALVLVVAVMMMGAGYAYWTDTLLVDTVVKTGSLDVDFVNVERVHISPEVEATARIVALGDNNDNKEDLDKAIIEIDNMYPMAEVRYKITAKNTGSISVNLDTVELSSFGHEITDLNMEVMEIRDGRAVIIPDGKFPDGRILKPDESTVFEVSFRLGADAPNETTEDKQVRYKMQLQYTQDYPASAKSPK